MDYRILWKQDNEEVLERWRLSIERIRQIPEEHCVREPFGSYFSSVASFILKIGKLTEEGDIIDSLMGLPISRNQSRAVDCK